MNRGKQFLLQRVSDDSIEAPLADKIRQLRIYKEVEGHSLFSGNSGVVLHAPLLASQLLSVARRSNIEDAADWLIRVLGTRTADGVFITALWGVSINRAIHITKGMVLLPFVELPDSPMKEHVIDASLPALNGSVWTWEGYFDVPGAAIVRKVKDFPYIGDPRKPFAKFSEFEVAVRDLVSFIQANTTGQPVVAGNWFEYEDHEFDINCHENYLSWFRPEVTPSVQTHIDADADRLEHDVTAFRKQQSASRNKLVRSMRRFALSQCRHEFIDQAIDLSIAFEILVGGGGSAASSWKTAVRSAQFVGGGLNLRLQNREIIAELYRVRSSAAHGGDLHGARRKGAGLTIQRAMEVYRRLVHSCLAHGLPGDKDWDQIELGNGPM